MHQRNCSTSLANLNLTKTSLRSLPSTISRFFFFFLPFLSPSFIFTRRFSTFLTTRLLLFFPTFLSAFLFFLVLGFFDSYLGLALLRFLLSSFLFFCLIYGGFLSDFRGILLLFLFSFSKLEVTSYFPIFVAFEFLSRGGFFLSFFFFYIEMDRWIFGYHSRSFLVERNFPRVSLNFFKRDEFVTSWEERNQSLIMKSISILFLLTGQWKQ